MSHLTGNFAPNQYSHLIFPILLSFRREYLCHSTTYVCIHVPTFSQMSSASRLIDSFFGSIEQTKILTGRQCTLQDTGFFIVNSNRLVGPQLLCTALGITEVERFLAVIGRSPRVSAQQLSA